MDKNALNVIFFDLLPFLLHKEEGIKKKSYYLCNWFGGEIPTIKKAFAIISRLAKSVGNSI